MSEPTPFEIRASIVPKSDQLNADDLLTGPITVTIEKVRQGDKEQPIIIDISEHRPYKPCKSMRRILIAALSDDPKQWVGKRMTLYCDPDVLWAGVRVGGIRISHLSCLDKPKTFLITQARGKRAEVTVKPLATEAEAKPATKPWKNRTAEEKLQYTLDNIAATKQMTREQAMARLKQILASPTLKELDAAGTEAVANAAADAEAHFTQQPTE